MTDLAHSFIEDIDDDDDCSKQQEKEALLGLAALQRGGSNNSSVLKSYKARGNYKCGRCGLFKKGGHVCDSSRSVDIKKTKSKCTKCNKYWSINANGCIRQHVCQNDQMLPTLQKEEKSVDRRSAFAQMYADRQSAESDRPDKTIEIETDATKRDKEEVFDANVQDAQVQCTLSSGGDAVMLLQELFDKDLITFPTYALYTKRYM